MFKTSIAALTAAPLLASGAAFAGPYVNLEMSGSYPDGAYSSGTLESNHRLRRDNRIRNRLLRCWWPYKLHTLTQQMSFGDVEFIGYVGGSYDKFYAELSGVTADDDVNWAAKGGVKFTF